MNDTNELTIELVESFAALLAFGGGRAVQREESFNYFPWKQKREWETLLRLDAVDGLEVAWLSETEGLGLALQGAGPGYSEITPDPQWEATVRYCIVRRAPRV